MLDSTNDNRINPINAYIGGRVREARKKLGLNQSYVGWYLKVSYQQIQKFEKGSNRIGSNDLRSFHTATPCTINPNATISAVVSAGDRKYSQTAAATMPKAKPATPATSAAANVAVANRIRLRI